MSFLKVFIVLLVFVGPVEYLFSIEEEESNNIEKIYNAEEHVVKSNNHIQQKGLMIFLIVIPLLLFVLYVLL